MDWGDRSPLQRLTIKGRATTGEYYLAAHTYNARGTYQINATGTVLSGWCTIGPGHYTFRLETVYGTLRLAALGDSYSSGEGTGVYEPSSDDCHHNPLAWPYWMAKTDRRRIVVGKDLACSGAISYALTQCFRNKLPQLTALSRLKPAPTLVTMTSNRRRPSSSSATRCLFAATGSCGRFTPDMNGLADQLDHVIKQSAEQASVRYVDVTSALAGHEICTKEPWIVGVGVRSSLQEEGHPKYPWPTRHRRPRPPVPRTGAVRPVSDRGDNRGSRRRGHR